MMRVRLRPFLIPLAVAALLLGLDFFWFRLCLFWIPTAIAWDSKSAYVLERQLRALPPHSSVLYVGSSVARYGFLPTVLTAPSAAESMQLLSRNGLNSLELLALAQRLKGKSADLIVLAVHPVDFRLERTFFVRPEERQADLYRISFLRELDPALALQEAPGWEERLAVLPALALGSYRYGRMSWDGLATLFQALGRGRSYQNYQGLPVAGITRRGWVGQESTLTVTGYLKKAGLDVLIPTELIGQGPLQVDLLPGCEGQGRKQELSRSGWHRLDLSCYRPGQALQLHVSTSRRNPQTDLDLSLRLSEFAGRALLDRLAHIEAARMPVLEDDVYATQDEATYSESFVRRQERFGEPGMEYLHALWRLRRELQHNHFQAVDPAFQAFARAAALLRQQGRLLIVNVPENPLTLKEYGDSPWYRGYLAFLSSQGHCFVDLSHSEPMQHFYDAHHLTYHGARSFSERLLKAQRSCGPDVQ